MEAVLSRKPENARIFTSIDHHKTPGVVRKAFPHNQDPKRTSVSWVERLPIAIAMPCPGADQLSAGDSIPTVPL